MIEAGRIIALSALLLVGSTSLATPAMADVTSCYDNPYSGRGEPVCTTNPGPPPPPDSMRPLGPPPLAGDAPWDGKSPLKYPLPKTPAAPTPMYQPPVAPVPAYRAQIAPVPDYSVPAPEYAQPPAPAYVAPAAPAAQSLATPAAAESMQEEAGATRTTSGSAAPSAAPVVAPDRHSTLRPVQDIESSEMIVAASQVESYAVSTTPVVSFVALVVAGVIMGVILGFGPGIRGITRGIMRR
jgi:hypothetical protein